MTPEINPEAINFEMVANLLVSENVQVVSPAELHGLLVGQLASGARLQADIWLRTACELMELAQLEHETSKIGLLGLYQQTLGQLEGADLDLSLLLPDDDYGLSQRVEALGRWCQGFMTGFGYQGKQTDASLSAESQEALQDLSQIAQVASEVEEDEESEADFAQLEEYVRMAALMLFSECNTPDEKAPPAPQLH
ncbi:MULTISPECIES: UPF0149 family protein [Neptunomonas]|uniref:Uncharacterized protein n=1 Tax=Neptunomonas marina TaxID=1815562 RepID=A0A437Q5J0_9GAMM|nr:MULTISPECIES: UPF0149 family protein [Neptunomonas]RVU29771.1 hypothetical protein EOE65_14570 [Neptunomonas marina]